MRMGGAPPTPTVVAGGETHGRRHPAVSFGRDRGRLSIGGMAIRRAGWRRIAAPLGIAEGGPFTGGRYGRYGSNLIPKYPARGRDR